MSGHKSKTNALLIILVLTLAFKARADEGNGAAGTQDKDPCLQDPKCRELYDGARRLSQVEQYEAALVMYQSAYSLKPRPWLLVNIGRMQQKLDRTEQAIATFKRFLADPAADTDAAFLNKAHEYLEAAERELAARQAKVAPLSQSPVVTALPPPQRSPVYKRWWLWTVVSGAVVLTAIGIGVGVSLAAQPQVGVPPGVSAFYPTF